MSSNKNTRTQYIFDPATISIRDWSWSNYQIGHATLNELRAHFRQFQAKKEPIVEVLGERAHWRKGEWVSGKPPKRPELINAFKSLKTWAPIQDPGSFFDWCYEYEWKVRRRIRFLEKLKKKGEEGRRKGIERHPGKWAPKKRRALNKGKVKMVSSRNYDRLQRKWEKNILQRLEDGDRWVSTYHSNFVLSYEARLKVTKLQKAMDAHSERMKERHIADQKYTMLRIEELKNGQD